MLKFNIYRDGDLFGVCDIVMEKAGGMTRSFLDMGFEVKFVAGEGVEVPVVRMQEVESESVPAPRGWCSVGDDCTRDHDCGAPEPDDDGYQPEGDHAEDDFAIGEVGPVLSVYHPRSPATNTNGLTYERWANAAGVGSYSDQAYDDWASGVDPTEYRAGAIAVNRCTWCHRDVCKCHI